MGDMNSVWAAALLAACRVVRPLAPIWQAVAFSLTVRSHQRLVTCGAITARRDAPLRRFHVGRDECFFIFDL
jgi:hypothetical protein